MYNVSTQGVDEHVINVHYYLLLLQKLLIKIFAHGALSRPARSAGFLRHAIYNIF